jgi:hypothetical protein
MKSVTGTRLSTDVIAIVYSESESFQLILYTESPLINSSMDLTPKIKCIIRIANVLQCILFVCRGSSGKVFNQYMISLKK